MLYKSGLGGKKHTQTLQKQAQSLAATQNFGVGVVVLEEEVFELTSARSGKRVDHQRGHKHGGAQDDDHDPGQTVLLHRGAGRNSWLRSLGGFRLAANG